MPDRNDPYDLVLDSVEEPVRCDDNLPVWKLWEFLNDFPGIGECFEPSQYRLGPLTEFDCSLRVIPTNISER